LVDTASQGLRHCGDVGLHSYWTSEYDAERTVAAQLCRGCPVWDQCGDAAKANNEVWGVWQGKDLSRQGKKATPITGPAPMSRWVRCLVRVRIWWSSRRRYRIRCLLGGHDWQFALMSNHPVVVSRACRRCLRFRIHPAEEMADQIQRIDDTAAVRHLFSRSGWPR
jgi:hypothetical protein